MSVSWFGVHRVLRDGSYEQPSALVVAVATPTSASPTPPPLPTSIGSAVTIPSPSRSPTPSRSGSTTPSRSPSAPASASPPPTASATSGTIQTFTRPGGRIVVDMGAASAGLVSVTPDPGWSWHQWTTSTWLRVDFQQDGSGTDSIFYVTWNGHPPLVQTGTG